MFLKIVIGAAVVLALFLGYVSTREGKFNYERSVVLNATPEKIFPYLSNFKLGKEWNPYDNVDPNMKRNFVGPIDQVGGKLEFDGNNQAGSGSLEFTKIVPNESVDMKLIMTKPVHAENMIHYQLTPEASGTRFSWSMSGDGGFVGKLINVFIDCEKMITDQFEAGFKNLKPIVEKQ